jgi:hypothetical protein
MSKIDKILKWTTISSIVCSFLSIAVAIITKEYNTILPWFCTLCWAFSYSLLHKATITDVSNN